MNFTDCFALFTATFPLIMCLVLLAGIAPWSLGRKIRPKYQILFMALLNILPIVLVGIFFNEQVKSSNLMLLFGIPCMIAACLIIMSWIGDGVISYAHLIAANWMLICAALNAAGGILLAKGSTIPVASGAIFLGFSALYLGEVKNLRKYLTTSA